MQFHIYQILCTILIIANEVLQMEWAQSLSGITKIVLHDTKLTGKLAKSPDVKIFMLEILV